MINQDSKYFFTNQILSSASYLNFLCNYYEKDPISKSNYSNLLTGIYELKYGVCANPALIMDLIYPSSAKMGKIKNFTTTNDFVLNNDSQYSAVAMGLAMNNLMVLEGPPGSGKTTFICELIDQLKSRDPSTRVLVTSQSHLAVNNVIKDFVKKDKFIDELARIRQKEGVVYSKDYSDYSEKTIFKNIVNSVDDKLRNILTSFDNSEDERFGNDFLKNNVSLVLNKKSVVGVTCNSIPGCHFENGEPFDYIIVDEVGQFSFYELMNVAIVAKKLILIGDINQLPSIISNSDRENDFNFAEDERFNKADYDFLKKENFIEHIFKNISKECKTSLNKQFRMSNAIGTFISETFYSGKVANGKDHNVEDALNFINYTIPTNKTSEIEDNDEEGEYSDHINEREIDIIKLLLKSKMLKDVARNKIAIISPYKKQVEKIRQELGPNSGIDNINSIDSFQGQEVEYIIFSCTRNYGTSSFLDDRRRINVAISRAKEKIFIIGNYNYINSHTKYIKKVINFKMNKYVHPVSNKKYSLSCAKWEVVKEFAKNEKDKSIEIIKKTDKLSNE